MESLQAVWISANSHCLEQQSFVKKVSILVLAFFLLFLWVQDEAYAREKKSMRKDNPAVLGKIKYVASSANN